MKQSTGIATTETRGKRQGKEKKRKEEEEKKKGVRKREKGGRKEGRCSHRGPGS